MKKIIYVFICTVLASNFIIAKPVSVSLAQNVAMNFYVKNSQKTANTFNLTYTGMSAQNSPVYYVFNVNTSDGFVIIAADDAAHPILGYSTEGNFVVPETNSNIDYWMKDRAAEITAIRNANVQADDVIINEWAGNFIKNASANRADNTNSIMTMSVAPLLHTTWNQSPNYNSLCPGGSVTGCVATAMAQIMKYWNYPNNGTGTSSYCDCTSSGYTMNYGTLTANYAATTYSWGLMPNSISGSNTAVATLMYHCGISVDMNYSPSESTAYVITADYPICAQASYVNHFKYDPTTIHGYYRSPYTDPNWIALLENELNIGRPLQYVGQDPNNGGHTWVCDGYDVNNNFHMNWGWGGTDNGYYAINTLNPNPYNFSNSHEALIGIKPLPYANFTVATNPTCIGQTLAISNTSSNSPTSWSYTLTGGTPSISTISNPTVTYATPGIYSITLITSNSTNTSTPVVKTVTISGPPSLTVTASPICIGGQATVVSTGANSYTLSNGFTGNNIVVSPSVTTNYTLKGYNGCTDSTTVTVVVNPLPNITAFSNDSIMCTGTTVTLTAGGGVSYSWSTGDTTQSIVISPTVNTTYTITGTSAQGCSNTTTINEVVSACAGIKENEITNVSSIYPNPTNGNFTISFNKISNNVLIEVYNNLGQLIMTQPAKFLSNTVNIAKEASGIYQIRISQDGNLIYKTKMLKN